MAPPTLLARVLLGLVLAVLFAYAAGPVTTNDLFWHVKTGEVLWQSGGAFPSVDPFSYTASERPWFLHEWLTQVVFYGVAQLGDLYALRILTGLLAVAIALAVYRFWRRELGTATWALLGIGVFLVLGANRLQTRPTLFTILCTILLVHTLTRDGARWSWRGAIGIVLLTLYWVNLHSVGLLAVPLYGAFVAGEACKLWLKRKGRTYDHVDRGHVFRHALTLAVVAAVTLATPSGLALWGFGFQDKGEVMEFIADEWAGFHLLWSDNEELTFEAWVAIHAILASLLAVYLVVGIALTRTADKLRAPWLPDPSRMALLLLCLAIGLMARRFHWMLCLSLALALGQLRQMVVLGAFPALASPAWRRAAGAAAWMALLSLLPLTYHRALRYQGSSLHAAMAESSYYTAESCAFFELGAVDFLRATGIEGKVFCHYGSGGILSYHLYPQVEVFIDSRIDLYGRAIYLDYLAASGGHPDQGAILERSGTDLYYRHWDLVQLNEPQGWIPIYRGDDGELWLRDVPRNEESMAVAKGYWEERGLAWSRDGGLGELGELATPTPR